MPLDPDAWLAQAQARVAATDLTPAIETMAIYCLVIALLLLFANPFVH